MSDSGITLKVTWPSRPWLPTKLSRFHCSCQQKKRRPLFCLHHITRLFIGREKCQPLDISAV